jgi:hypothetical protein
MAKTLKDAIGEIVDARMRSGLGPMVRAVVTEVLQAELGLQTKRGPGRPPKSASLAGATNGGAAPARRGRRSKYTPEQKRLRAAAYQRQYRLKQKAAKAKAKS